MGRAALHGRGNIYTHAKQRVLAEERTEYSVLCVALIHGERTEPLFSASDWHDPYEWKMPAEWKRRRPVLDKGLETHIHRRGP